MAEKTLAEIARAAWMEAANSEDHWEITAAAVRAAVIEECAKIADAKAEELSLYWQRQGWDKPSLDIQRASEGAKIVASAIRAARDGREHNETPERADG